MPLQSSLRSASKRAHSAVTQILLAIYEEDFLPCSHGYRPGVSAHDAIKALTDELQFGRHQFVVEADIKGFFEIAAIEKELQSLKVRTVEEDRWIELGNSIETFLSRLNQSVEKLSIAERQKILRVLVKQVTVGEETITVHHSIPVSNTTSGTEKSESYPLCTRGHRARAGQHLSALRAGFVV